MDKVFITASDIMLSIFNCIVFNIRGIFSINVSEFLNKMALPEGYTDNRFMILSIPILLLIVVCFLINKKQVRVYTITIFNGVCLSVLSIVIGCLINAIGIIEIEETNMILNVFVLFSFLLLTYFFTNIIIYHIAAEKLIAEILQYLICEIMLILILLGIYDKLDVAIILACTSSICLLLITNESMKDKWISAYSISRWIKKHVKRNQQISNKEVVCYNSENQKADNPISNVNQLFLTRKKQLEYFVTFLKRDIDEPFAIAVTGSWGTGKTSFINAFKNKISKDRFIYIEPKIENDMNKMLNNLSVQFETIFKENGIYTGRGSALKNYFDTIFRIMGKSDFGIIEKVFSFINKDDKYGYYDIKKKLNEDILKLLCNEHDLNNRIYIIVDDLDRSNDAVKLNTFNFIKEVVDLKGCTVIFSVDYNEVQSRKINSKFLEKYIQDRFELVDVETKEMVEYYADNNIYLNQKFLEDMSFIVKKKAEQLRTNLLEKLIDVISKIEEDLNVEDVKGDNKDKKIIANLENIKKQLIEDYKNPRKIKRLYRELERILYSIDLFWFSSPETSNNDLSKEDWADIIFRVAFVKIFMEKEFDNTIKFDSLNNFIDMSNSFAIRILSNSSSMLFLKDEEKKIIDIIIFHLYKDDVISTKTEKQKVRDELKANELKVPNIKKYFEVIFYDKNGYRYFKTIISFVVGLENEEIKQGCIIDILREIERYSRLNREELSKYLKKYFWSFAKEIETFNGEQISILNSLLENIERAIIFGFKTYYVSAIQFGNLEKYSYAELENKHFKEINDFKGLFKALKVISNDIGISINQNSNEILWIESLYLEIRKIISVNSLELKKVFDTYYNKIVESLTVIKLLDNQMIKLKSNKLIVNKLAKEFYFKTNDNANRECEIEEAVDIVNEYIINNIIDDSIYSYFSSFCQEIEKLIDSKYQFVKVDWMASLTKIYNKLSNEENSKNHETWWNYTLVRIKRIELYCEKVECKKMSEG